MAPPQSSAARILSASAASWFRIAVTVLTQIALVPLYLAHWNTSTYGAWLLLQAVIAVVNVVDLAHHDYVGYECLRMSTTKRSEITQAISSAAPIALLLACTGAIAIWLIGLSPIVQSWIGTDPVLIKQWRFALLLQAGVWACTGSLGGLIVRWLTPFGYNSHFAWWGVLFALLTAIFPAIAIVLGADLWAAAITLAATNIVYYILFFGTMSRVIRREGLKLRRPKIFQGINQGIRSLWLTGKNGTDIARQQGSRIVLAPLSGMVELAAFSTMRTGSNFALQGLNTITGPVMPELMRFLVMKDQQRTESAFAVVWFVVCTVLAPAVVVVQYVAPTLFPFWTHGKIPFDACLFAMLSLTVLVVALAQPATAVLQGNNLVGIQLLVSILAAAVAIGCMLWLVPLWGIKGAACSLLTAELVALGSNVAVACRNLRTVELRWPWLPFAAAAASVIVAAGGTAGLSLLSNSYHGLCLVLVLLLQAMIVIVYWRLIPTLARIRAYSLLIRFLPRRFHPPVRLSVDGHSV